MAEASEPVLLNHPKMPKIGQILADRYQLTAVLGAGGFAVVYLARDNQAGGKVALKVLSPRKSRDPVFSQRFLQEVRVVRDLKHHNTIKVYDIGVTETGCLFMVQEYLDGVTLEQHLAKAGRLPPKRTVHIARQVLRSLLEAHRQGIIHRDLKPANIMICNIPGEEDYAKVLDFGVAKAEDAALSQLETNPQDFMYTPKYSAPEVLDNRESTPASDLFSLGLTMFEMLTGRPAVTGKTVWHIIAKQVENQPITIPPPLVSHKLAEVLAHALEKDPANRYQSAREMLEALSDPEMESALSSFQTEPTPEHHPTPRSKRAVIWLVVLVVLAVSTAVALTLLHRYQDTSSESSSNLPLEDPNEAARRLVRAEQEACDDGDWDTCLTLAMRYDQGSGVAPDNARATALLVRLCEEGARAQICADVANRFHAGLGVDVDVERSLEFATLACNLGDIDACWHAGSRYLTGSEVPRSLERAIPSLSLACEAGRGPACLGAGVICATREHPLTDYPRALEFFLIACEAELVEGCARAAAMLMDGIDLEQDTHRAVALLERACQMGDLQSCARLGHITHRGLGVSADTSLAFQLYSRACDGEIAQGCLGMAFLLEAGEGVAADLAQAVELFRRTCELDEREGCFRLGRLLEDQPQADSDQVRAAYRRACDLGHQRACREIE